MTALDDLIRAVEAATGPDILLDVAIARHFGQLGNVDYFTASIDAVVALIRREMPDVSSTVRFLPGRARPYMVGMPRKIGVGGCMTYSVEVDHITEALARLEAFLRAFQARQTEDATT